jgi:hypothetical protein
VSAPGLETILTSPVFFGLETATPVQRAKCRIIDGQPLGELATHPDVRELLGCDPAEVDGVRPLEVIDVSATRVGKTLFGAALAVHASQTVEVEGTGWRPGDIIRFFACALKLEGTRPLMSHLLAAIRRSPAIASLVVDEPSLTSVKFAHRSGAVIEVTPIPIDRAGGSAISTYCAGVFVDEAPRMLGESDAVKNYDHLRGAVLSRMLPGALFLGTGAPWQPYGPIYDQFTDHFGKPSRELVVLRTRGDKANPTWWTEARKAELRARPGFAYVTDHDAEFAAGELMVMPAAHVEAAFAPLPPHVFYDLYEPAIFCDPSQMKHDTWAAVCGAVLVPRVDETDGLLWVDPADPRVRLQKGPYGCPIQYRSESKRMMALLQDDHGFPLRDPDYKRPLPIFRILEIMGWDPGGAQISADVLVAEVVKLARRHGARRVVSDQGEQYGLEALFRLAGISDFHPMAWTSRPQKTLAMDRLRSLVVEHRLSLPPHARLRGELLRVRAKAAAGGYEYTVPGQGHGDFLSCLVLAMRAEMEGLVSGSLLGRSTARHADLGPGDFHDVNFAPSPSM